eukprot:s2937_g9.t1
MRLGVKMDFWEGWLDALDSKNHAETVQEALYDPKGHRLESYLKVKLATATPAPAVSVPVIKQDPGTGVQGGDILG